MRRSVSFKVDLWSSFLLSLGRRIPECCYFIFLPVVVWRRVVIRQGIVFMYLVLSLFSLLWTPSTPAFPFSFIIRCPYNNNNILFIDVYLSCCRCYFSLVWMFPSVCYSLTLTLSLLFIILLTFPFFHHCSIIIGSLFIFVGFAFFFFAEARSPVKTPSVLSHYRIGNNSG